MLFLISSGSRISLALLSKKDYNKKLISAISTIVALKHLPRKILYVLR